MKAGDHDIVVHVTNDGKIDDGSKGARKIGFMADDAIVLPAGVLADD
jgi:uncharacterized protein YjlB